MTRKNGWEEPTTGPDWIDVETMMRAIGALHSGDVMLSVSPAGTGSTGGVDTVVSIFFHVLPGSSLPEGVHCKGTWPCNEHSTMAAHLYAELYALDAAISKVYKQEGLWN